MKKGLLVTLFLSFILMLAACGGEDTDATSDTSDTPDSEATEQVEETDSSAEASANNDVNIIATNYDLGQDEYVVQSGEEVTLTLTNEEGHHGISIDEFDVTIEGDGEVTFTPDEPGEYRIYCNIFCGEGHGEMVATLVVI
ncbi:cupredoxin domain-containing protein [Oceanobacillus bengalensis]|uniref:Uncharacterized protein n=1 Tax=Oceanobacillus bengalensis TaxID=1435466 RepID=A0A494Z4W9_9BACI|nr:cupredoxin domain-containing protein [Oceanobacillus bengalensis]RKQ17590.1 hypothetical protein D8M05_04110 [Oceanobacillus bengalensis]